MNTQLDLRLRHTCPHCQKQGRPLLRVYGYPNDKILFQWEAEGRIRLAGCCVPNPVVDYECRHCSADWNIRAQFIDVGRFCPPESSEHP